MDFIYVGEIVNTHGIKGEVRIISDFKYKKDGEKFICTIPNRRLDIEANVNDIAEEIGRLYGYHNLVGTLPVQTQKKGEYKGSIGYRKH